MCARSRRNTGLGRRLVEAVSGHARDGWSSFNLTVVAENLAAQRLYISLGFVAYGREKHALKQDGRYYDEILMVRFLGPARK